jgi:hypothetical protein
VHGVLDDPDGDRGPWLLRGGFSSARYVPSSRALTGLRVNAAEVRHRMCAPVARKARADQDKNLRSVRSVPGPEAAQQVRGRRLPGVGIPADRGAQQAPVPDSAAATHRACRNAPSRDRFDGLPKNAPFYSCPARPLPTRPWTPRAARSRTPRARSEDCG